MADERVEATAAKLTEAQHHWLSLLSSGSLTVRGRSRARVMNNLARLGLVHFPSYRTCAITADGRRALRDSEGVGG